MEALQKAWPNKIRFSPVFFTCLGITAISLFQSNVFLPLSASVVTFIVISVFLLWLFKTEHMGALMLILWFLYILPFIHIIPYLWFNFEEDVSLLFWVMPLNPYMLDEQIVELTAMIGAVGGLGFALGVSLSIRRINNRMDLVCMPQRTLSKPLWLAWVSIGIILSWLAAPQETVLTAAYTASKSLLDNLNFSSAWMVSYAFLTFAFCDALLDRDPFQAKIKRNTVFLAIAYVVIYLQLMRGDRESLSFVFGAFLVYFFWAAPSITKEERQFPWKMIVMIGLTLMMASFIVGAARSALAGLADKENILTIFAQLYDSGIFSFSYLFHGTWSAVLLTPFSVAGDYVDELLSFKFGKTYLDLLLSLPPGFVADMIGYSRPIDGFAGPAWEMLYGIGGTHATVVPFMNFGMIGVFLLTGIWAYLFTRWEISSLQRRSVLTLSFFLIIVTAAPHWLWYGEKSIINALIIWLGLSFSYLVCLSRSGARARQS